MMNHYVMLQRNLIYTGITRAKKILVMIGTRKALRYAVGNVTVTKRNTLLKERLWTRGMDQGDGGSGPMDPGDGGSGPRRRRMPGGISPRGKDSARTRKNKCNSVEEKREKR